VRRSWDPKEGALEPKSERGRRSVPLASALRALLAEHRLGEGKPEGYVFARNNAEPFDPSTVVDRAKALSAYLGHASIAITLDRYLMPGSEAEAAGLLNRHLAGIAA
jgi:integrase